MNLVDMFASASYNKADTLSRMDRAVTEKSPAQRSGDATPQLAPHSADSSRVQKAIDDINRKLQHQDQEVVFDYDPKANRVWLNVIDKTTGKVLDELPPDIIRKLADSLGDIKGLVIDKRS